MWPNVTRANFSFKDLDHQDTIDLDPAEGMDAIKALKKLYLRRINALRQTITDIRDAAAFQNQQFHHLNAQFPPIDREEADQQRDDFMRMMNDFDERIRESEEEIEKIQKEVGKLKLSKELRQTKRKTRKRRTKRRRTTRKNNKKRASLR